MRLFEARFEEFICDGRMESEKISLRGLKTKGWEPGRNKNRPEGNPDEIAFHNLKRTWDNGDWMKKANFKTQLTYFLWPFSYSSLSCEKMTKGAQKIKANFPLFDVQKIQWIMLKKWMIKDKKNLAEYGKFLLTWTLMIHIVSAMLMMAIMRTRRMRKYIHLFRQPYIPIL